MKIVSITILVVLFFTWGQSIAATSVTQHGITWTFDTDYQVGQFANGDYWVVDPGGGVDVIGISPGAAPHPTTGRDINGSMLNPSTRNQGYDADEWVGAYYTETTNVGKGITESTPLTITGNASLVSTISNLSPGGTKQTSYIKAAAVLTCLSSTPPAGSFRPGISGTTKTIYNTSNINYSLLKSLSCPVAKPSISEYAGYFQMVWIAHSGSWTSRYMHPSDGIPANYYYPEYMANAALMLHMDYPVEDKTALLINYIQLGIDLYSYLEAGGTGWAPDGGHSSGRKWPILFAGLMLNAAPMKNIGQISGDYLYSNGHGPANVPADYKHFGEDGQTFYVAQSDVNLTNGPTWAPDSRTAPNYPYSASMIGMPEWGIRYSEEPNRSDSAWGANYRRIQSGAQSWVGTALAAMFMDAKPLWNHNAHFDYVDRYMAITTGNPDPFGYTVYGEATGSRPEGIIGPMWSTYRQGYSSRRLFRNVRVGEVEP